MVAQTVTECLGGSTSQVGFEPSTAMSDETSDADADVDKYYNEGEEPKKVVITVKV